MVKTKRIGMSLLLGSGMMVAGPLISACGGSGVSAADWAATEGAIGRINMEAVQEAFEKSKSIEEFEKRLNEIYEGDKLVLVRAKEEGQKRTIEAFEDLDGDRDIDPAKDDLLFSITNENNSNNLQGHGANRHHSSFGGGGNFLFTYLIFSSLTRGGFGYGYATPRSRAPQMESERSRYRNSTAYSGGSSGGQVKRNSDYYNKQQATNRTSYSNSGRQLSPARQSYIGTQSASGAFKTSNTGVRSGFGKFGANRSGGRGGGVRGGGGAQVIIGHWRR